MKDDILEKIISFFFKNLWLVCGVLICINSLSMLVSTYSIIKNTAYENITSLSTELSHRITVTYDLLESISFLPLMSDTTVPVKDRAAALKPFAMSFNLWMIGVVDLDGSISSTLAYSDGKVQRDYIPRIQQSGVREMTDAFSSGSTGELNFTQLVPVKQDGEVISIVFAATLLPELKAVTTRNAAYSNGYYVLLDSKLNIIVHPSDERARQSIPTLHGDEHMLYKPTKQSFLEDLKTHTMGTFVSVSSNTLYYTIYTPLSNTPWTLIHRVNVLTMFKPALVGMLIQNALYLVVFIVLYVFGNMYMKHALLPVDNLVKHFVNLNKEILHTDKLDNEEVSNIIRISRTGLKDELTGLPTRMLFKQILNARLRVPSSTPLAAFFFIDMDNLKTINDSFGHKYGDMALQLCGTNLLKIAAAHNGLCARFGGDEFVLFVQDLQTADDALALGETLLDNLHGAIDKDGVQHFFHASIGIALHPLHATQIDTVIQYADNALYAAKQQGKSTFVLYSPDVPAGRSDPAVVPPDVTRASPALTALCLTR